MLILQPTDTAKVLRLWRKTDMEQNQKTGLRVKRTKQQVQKALLELLKKVQTEDLPGQHTIQLTKLMTLLILDTLQYLHQITSRLDQYLA